MSMILLIEQIWQSSDPGAEAKSRSGLLSNSEKEALLKVVTRLDAYVIARAIVDDFVFPTPEVSEKGPVSENMGDFLLLLMFGMYHSDSLVFHSPELREGQLSLWSQRTNQPIARVRAACALGPTGLRALLESR